MCAVSQAVESGRLAYQAVEQCAQELNLIPLGTPTAAVRRPVAAAPPNPVRRRPRRSRRLPSCLPTIELRRNRRTAPD